MPDDADYMSTWEFANLSTEAHHAVWQAHREGQIDAVPYSENQPNGILRYRRDQVDEIVRGLAVRRG